MTASEHAPVKSSKPAQPAKGTSKGFKVEGDFQMGRVRQHFVIEVAAASETAAKDRVFATLGSRHGVNRRQVAIAAAKALGNDDVSDPVVRHELGLKHQE
jgi:ribosomal protein L20A (L18A)